MIEMERSSFARGRTLSIVQGGIIRGQKDPKVHLKKKKRIKTQVKTENEFVGNGSGYGARNQGARFGGPCAGKISLARSFVP